MAIKLRCPNGHSRTVGSEFAGKDVTCEECGHVWHIPPGEARGREAAGGEGRRRGRYGAAPRR